MFTKFISSVGIYQSVFLAILLACGFLLRPPAATAQSMRVCAGQVPQGWIKVDDAWSPTSCGRPSTIVQNVWIIERYSNKRTGTTVVVCASAPTPNGWVVVDTAWRPTACGKPSVIIDNVKTIRRVN